MSFLGIGKKKKRPELKLPIGHDLPPLPPLEDFEVDEHEKHPSFPVYEKETSEFEPKRLDVKIPKREKNRKPIAESIIGKSMGNKPVFVEIDDYKDALEKIEQIKNKIRDAEQVLDEITKLKQEEDHQLEAWRRDISGVKDKLLDIDNKLFES